MKQTVFISLCFLFFNLNAFGQFSIPIQDWANNVDGRTLIVELAEENPKELKKLSKKGDQAVKEYKDNISEHNERLKQLIPKYWPFENEILFKKTGEVDAVVKSKNTNYLILDCRYSEEIRESVSVYYTIDVYTMVLYYAEYGNKLRKRYSVDTNDDGRSNLRKGGYIFKISMPDYFIYDREVMFALSQFKTFIERAKTEGSVKKITRFGFKIIYADKANAKHLKEKTLLIPKELLQIDEEKVKEMYAFNYKVVPMAEIGDLLTGDNKEDYAFYQVVWTDKGRYWTFVIVDNETGTILAENPTTDKKVQLRLAVPLGAYRLATYYKTADIQFVINEDHFEKLKELTGE
jgi:hypothetical protein